MDSATDTDTAAAAADTVEVTTTYSEAVNLPPSLISDGADNSRRETSTVDAINNGRKDAMEQQLMTNQRATLDSCARRSNAA